MHVCNTDHGLLCTVYGFSLLIPDPTLQLNMVLAEIRMLTFDGWRARRIKDAWHAR